MLFPFEGLTPDALTTKPRADARLILVRPAPPVSIGIGPNSASEKLIAEGKAEHSAGRWGGMAPGKLPSRLPSRPPSGRSPTTTGDPVPRWRRGNPQGFAVMARVGMYSTVVSLQGIRGFGAVPRGRSYWPVRLRSLTSRGQTLWERNHASAWRIFLIETGARGHPLDSPARANDFPLRTGAGLGRGAF